MKPSPQNRILALQHLEAARLLLNTHDRLMEEFIQKDIDMEEMVEMQKEHQRAIMFHRRTAEELDPKANLTMLY